MVTEALIAMRGAPKKKHKEQHKKGDLQLLETPLSYKGTSIPWLKRTTHQEDWLKALRITWQKYFRQKRMREIFCPECSAEHAASNWNLKVKVGFFNLTCKQCRTVTKTSTRSCACGALWHKCGVHQHSMQEAQLP